MEQLSRAAGTDKEKPKRRTAPGPKPKSMTTGTLGDVVHVQALMKGAIHTRIDCSDQHGRKVQGHVFNLEIARDQLEDEAVLHKLERCFDGNPVHVKMENNKGDIQLKFSTFVTRFQRTIRKGDEDEQIKVIVVKIVAFRVGRFNADKLHDLQLEDVVRVRFESYQPTLGEFAEPGPHKVKRK